MNDETAHVRTMGQDRMAVANLRSRQVSPDTASGRGSGDDPAVRRPTALQPTPPPHHARAGSYRGLAISFAILLFSHALAYGLTFPDSRFTQVAKYGWAAAGAAFDVATPSGADFPAQ